MISIFEKKDPLTCRDKWPCKHCIQNFSNLCAVYKCVSCSSTEMNMCNCNRDICRRCCVDYGKRLYGSSNNYYFWTLLNSIHKFSDNFRAYFEHEIPRSAASEIVFCNNDIQKAFRLYELFVCAPHTIFYFWIVGRILHRHRLF